jgi:hypothetical protein
MRWKHLRSLALIALTAACASARPSTSVSESMTAGPPALAQVYFWRARPGMLDAYNRYIREVAEPIDAEAHRAGAFLSVTTYQTADTTLGWTHMRVFLLRDSAQWRGLSSALTAAGVRLQPDSAQRRRQGEYSATLRDRVGATLMGVLR